MDHTDMVRGAEMTAAVIIVLLMGIAAALWACCAVSARTEEMERRWHDGRAGDLHDPVHGTGDRDGDNHSHQEHGGR